MKNQVFFNPDHAILRAVFSEADSPPKPTRMKKHSLLAAFLLLATPLFVTAQSPAAPPPPACTGTEPLVTDGEILTKGVTKWYYGPAATFSNLTLRGGTLIICGDLTVSNYTMDSGTVHINPAARFVIASGNGAGLVLYGNSAIYNYGTCEIQRNLSLNGGYASAGTPNLIVNATSASVFKMSNQYLVINNPYSWFVNNGSAEFWGIIVDSWAGAGVVEMGSGSSTRMAVLINKIPNSYRVTSGTACLNVFQYSQFYGVLTSSPTLNACVAAGHTSDSGCIPWGCAPNNWGAAQVVPACTSCASIAVLPVHFTGLQVARTASDRNLLTWQCAGAQPGMVFRLLRSADGRYFSAVDSFTVSAITSSYSITDKLPPEGLNHYMIQYTQPQNGTIYNSKTVKISSPPATPFSIYPNPFDKKLTIRFPVGTYPEKVMLTDMLGRNIRINWHWQPDACLAEVMVEEFIPADIYMIHIRTNKSNISRTILKK